MQIAGYDIGPIRCRGAFTADFVVPTAMPIQHLVTNMEIDEHGNRPEKNGFEAGDAQQIHAAARHVTGIAKREPIDPDRDFGPRSDVS